MAGVCRRVVQSASATLDAAGLIEKRMVRGPFGRNLANLIVIKCADFAAWVAKGVRSINLPNEFNLMAKMWASITAAASDGDARKAGCRSTHAMKKEDSDSRENRREWQAMSAAATAG